MVFAVRNVCAKSSCKKSKTFKKAKIMIEDRY